MGNEATAAWQISRSYAILDGYLNVDVCVCVCVCVCVPVAPFKCWTFMVRPFLQSKENLVLSSFFLQSLKAKHRVKL